MSFRVKMIKQYIQVQCTIYDRYNKKGFETCYIMMLTEDYKEHNSVTFSHNIMAIYVSMTLPINKAFRDIIT